MFSVATLMTFLGVAVSLNATPTPADLTDCMLSIARAYFRPSSLVVVTLRDRGLAEDVLRRLNSASLWAISVFSDVASTVPWGQKAEAIVLTAGADGVSDQVATLQRRGLWDARAKVAVLGGRPCCPPQECASAARAMLGELSLARVRDAVVVLASCTTVHVYTAFLRPTPQQCEPTEPVLLNQWLPELNHFLHGSPLFPDKTPRNFHSCPLRVSTFPWNPFVKMADTPQNESAPLYDRGVEIRILMAVARKMNFSVVFLPLPANKAKWGERLPNGTWTGVLGNVQQGRADVGCASFTVHQSRTEVFDSTVSYTSNAVSWVVPRARQIPRWKNLGRVFSASFWMLVILAFVLASAVLWGASGRSRAADYKLYPGGLNTPGRSNHAYSHREAFIPLKKSPRQSKRALEDVNEPTVTTGSKCEHDAIKHTEKLKWSKSGYLCLGGAALTAWGAGLGQPSPWTPRAASLRAALLIWLWYCQHVSTAYQSSLVSVLTEPALERQVRSLTQLVAAGLSCGYTTGLLEYQEEGESALEVRLRARLEFCPRDQECLERVARAGDYALLTDRGLVEYLTANRYSDANGRPLLVLLDQDVLRYPVMMFVSRGAVLQEVLDNVIWRLLGAGLPSLWRQQLNAEARPRPHSSAVPNQVLSLAHLQGSFYLLLTGVALASVIFCAELLLVSCRSRTRA